MQRTEIHDGKYLKVLWDGESRIIGIDWKESTSGMTDEDFKAELAKRNALKPNTTTAGAQPDR